MTFTMDLGSVISIVLLFYLYDSCCCQGMDASEITKDLQTAFNCKTNPAMAVAVVKDGKLVYSKGFGHTDLSETNPVTDETLFGIASISKSFAAALLVKMLYQDTKLTLDSKVQELLGKDFVMPDEIRTKMTTFEDMLAHRLAMLPNNRIRLDQNLTRNNLLSRLALLPSPKQFRVDFVYNNLIYGLVSRIAEIIGKGKKWEDLITENFFQPLGMNKSTFATILNYSRSDLAVGYHDYDGPKQYERISAELSRRWADLAGSGAVVSSVKDMAKWMNFHIFKGQNDNGDQVMDKKLVDELHRPRVVANNRRFMSFSKPEYPTKVMENNYALGLRTGSYRGYDLVTHTGGTYGYNSYMALLPTEKIGVIALVTSRDTSFRLRAPVVFYLLDQALGLDPWINSTTICTYPYPWYNGSLSKSYRPKKTNSSLQFSVEDYQGLYTNKAFGNLVIEYNSTLESLIALYGWGTWEMIQWPSSSDPKTERFFGKGIGPIFAPDMKPFNFITDPDNKNTIVGIKAAAFDSTMPPIFCKEGRKMDVCEDIASKTYPKQEPFCPKSPNGSSCIHYRREILLTTMLLIFLAFF